LPGQWSASAKLPSETRSERGAFGWSGSF
jgi:hypothetical protein